MIELRTFGPLPSRTIGTAVAVRNGNWRCALLVSDILCGTGELSIPKRLEVVGNKGLAGSEAYYVTINDIQGVIDGQQTTMVQILGSNTKTVPRGRKPLEVVELRKNFGDGRITTSRTRHVADEPQGCDRQPQAAQGWQRLHSCNLEGCLMKTPSQWLLFLLEECGDPSWL